MVTVMFDCKACGLVKHPVQVPARTTEDVCDWVAKVGVWVGDEHRKVSPLCSSRTCDLYLPNPAGSEFIGQQVE